MTRESVQKAMTTLQELWKPGVSAPAGMTRDQLHVQRSALRESLSRLDAIQTSCGACRHYEWGSCAKYGDVPPEFSKTANDCPDWEYDGVPW